MVKGFATFAEARRWIRGPAVIDGDWILIDQNTAEMYSPLATPPRRLMLALAGIRTRDDIAGFVSRFGLLKHGPDAPRLREPIAEFEQEAHLCHVVLRIAHALRGAVRGDADQLAILRASSQAIAPMFDAPPRDDRELMMQASKAVAWIISSRLGETRLRVDALCEYDVPDNAPDVFTFNVQPPDLLGWVYQDVAQALVHRQPMGSCPACGRMFVPDDARQRFCQPSCASRTRFRKFKARKAAATRTQQKGRSGHGKTTRTR